MLKLLLLFLLILEKCSDSVAVAVVVVNKERKLQSEDLGTSLYSPYADDYTVKKRKARTPLSIRQPKTTTISITCIRHLLGGWEQ